MKKKILAPVLLLIFLFVALTPVALAVQSDPATVQIVIDLTPPAISLSGVTDGQAYYAAVAPTVNVTDSGGCGLNGQPTITLTQGGNPVAWASGQAINQPGSYVLTVSADDNAGHQSSQSISFNLSMPGIPTLVATASSQTAIHLAWNSVSGADNGYELYRDGGGTPIHTGAGTSFDDTALGINTQHSYIVKAMGALGSTPSNQVDLYTLANPPTNAVISNLTDSAVTISWNANGNPVGTQYSVTGGGISQTPAQATINLAGLNPGTAYNLSITALNGDGVASSALPAGFTTEQVPPTLLTDKNQYTLGDTMTITVTDQSKAGTGSVQVQLTGIGVSARTVTCTEGPLGTFNGTQAFSWDYNPQSGGVTVTYGQLSNNITYVTILPSIQTDKNGYSYGDTASITVTDHGKSGAGNVSVAVQGILKNTNVTCSEGPAGTFTGTLTFNDSFNPLSGGLVITYNYTNNGQATHVQLNDYYITQQAPSPPATPAQPLTYTLSLNQQYVTMKPGDTVSLSLTQNGSDGSSQDVTQSAGWISSNPAVATISQGTITAVSSGQTTISASNMGVTTKATVVVSQTTYTISVNPPYSNINVGGSVNLSATKSGSDGSSSDMSSTATWTSSNPSVATVSGGSVTAGSPGQATITASAGGLTGNATVMVNAQNTTTFTLSISKVLANIKVDENSNFTVTKIGSDGSSVDVTQTAAWTSDTPTVATVSGGVVTAVSAGQAVITASLDSSKAQAVIIVSNNTAANSYTISVQPGDVNLVVGGTTNLTATLKSSNGSATDVTQTANWTVSNPSIATVNKGCVTAIASGQTTILVTVNPQSSPSAIITGQAALNVTQTSDGGSGGSSGGGSGGGTTGTSTSTGTTTTTTTTTSTGGSGMQVTGSTATITGSGSGGSSTGSGGGGGFTVSLPTGVDTVQINNPSLPGITINTPYLVSIVAPDVPTSGMLVYIKPVTSTSLNGVVLTAFDYKATAQTKLYFPTDDVENSSVYAMGNNGQWTYIPSIYDPTNNRLIVDVTQAGKYALIKSSPVAFADMSKDQWATQAAAWLVQRGIMDSPQGDFNPTDLISGKDFASITARAAGYQGVVQASDGPITNADAVQIVSQVLNAAAASSKGYVDANAVTQWANSYSLNSTQMTRADAAVAIYGLLHSSTSTTTVNA